MVKTFDELARSWERQPYVRQLAAALDSGALPILPGTAAMLVVRHDSDCPILTGAGYCACLPDLELRASPIEAPSE